MTEERKEYLEKILPLVEEAKMDDPTNEAKLEELRKSYQNKSRFPVLSTIFDDILKDIKKELLKTNNKNQN